MKNLLKKLNIMSNQSDDEEEGSPFRGDKSHEILSSPDRISHKPFSGLSNWLTSVANRRNRSPHSTSNAALQDQTDSSDSAGLLSSRLEALENELGSAALNNPAADEEYQIQIALELSAREDPEAVQIEAVKQISLGSTASDNTPAEVVAYRYWGYYESDASQNYNALSYDDKVLDGFYDLYGVVTDSSVGKMPSLMDLQETSLTETVMWEAILVNRAGDSNLLKLEEKALGLAMKSRLGSMGESKYGYLVRKLAVLVSDYMGGPVADPENVLRAWQSLSFSLKENLGSKVLPLGSLTVGLPRHRALLFKVLADSLGIPCKLVKGQQFSGSNDVAMNFIKLEDGREYIVDLMADPGILIPADAAGLYREYDESLLFSASPSSQAASSSSGVPSSFEDRSDFGTFDRSSKISDVATAGHHEFIENTSRNLTQTSIEDDAEAATKITSPDESKPNSVSKHPYIHGRSPSWTEGVSSPIVRRMKVKDVSQYMLDATKENPQLAQKIHDVLLESGVVAPPNLFSDIYAVDSRVSSGTQENSGQNSVPSFLPPLPHQNRQRYTASNQQEHLPEVAPAPAPAPPGFYAKNVPVAAAAAAAAAVVASSMVVAAAKSSADTLTLDLPVAAAATATAAAVVATKAATAAVSKQYEQGMRIDVDVDSNDPQGSGNREHDSEAERISDRSVGNESAFSDTAFDEVAEFDIPWDEIALGERIGLGSYGEVYRGEWHGTEVAVKKFLDQDMFGESLEEFRSEVRIMTKIRHPNVVLFMGAVTRPPHLSIITEFLPRGSLYRLIHRPNNQVDERRRLRMALDASRGMNYLHSCNPAIVHRDLKSPNLLVDKNWVVKVCDFGLSRRKHGTYLSSRSTAGTAEWMAPEVLRNEPSNEKCDVYSFGVILWELFTLQQPWSGMNPMQVVGAVGYQHRRLDIPNDIEPVIADIIRRCWQTDPKLRPSFAEIMAELKSLQKLLTGGGLPRSRSSSNSKQDRGQRLDESTD